MSDETPVKFKIGSVYWKAFSQAIEELEALKRQEKEIAVRKAQLYESVKALGPLVVDVPFDVNSLSLADAIRFVFSSSQRSLTVTDIRTKLVDLGYDTKKFGNLLASIHTALTRMGEAEELIQVDAEGKEKKKFGPGPELKSVPEMEMPSLKEIAEKMTSEAKENK